MDVLSCNTASRCAECHHSTASGCALESALAGYEASLAPRAPAIPLTLQWQDTRPARVAA